MGDAVKVMIYGACGRMGHLLCTLAHDDSELELVAAVDNGSLGDIGRDIGEVAGIGSISVSVTSDCMSDCDVIVDFSVPEASLSLLRNRKEKPVPIVMGTTGFDEAGLKEIDESSSALPLFQASNMSIGANVLFALAKQASKALTDYDIEVIEMHHRFKEDAPSGTALSLLDALESDKERVYGRKGKTGARGKDEIGVHVLRGGDVAGDHTVMFAGMGERVEITHRAHSRDVFAQGALKVAKFMAGKSAGCYSMKDYLGQ